MAIYTAPVKSLANQKYSEICEKFPSVGLITGDVSTNPTADVIIMTAEVLRNHLMSNSSLLSRAKHIILDEAHYLGDPQRGYVWEEIIISFQKQMRFVLLSATLPNGNELSQWLSNTTNVETHTITQYHRPVPLRINAVSESHDIDAIKEGDNPPNMLLISEICKQNGILGAPSTKYILPKDPPFYTIASYANDVVKLGYTPLIVFCLSRFRCVQVSKQISGRQSNQALDIFEAASQDWDASIKSSDQYALVHDLIQKGVGIHHSGIIPILRETVELLFSKGLLVVLVATETFALGVNSPARAVMLSSLVKWGGTSFRSISSSEFSQMAGRAGRRGFDTHGDVFIYLTTGTSPEFVSSVIEKKSEVLKSQMRVTSSLVLSCVSCNVDPFAFLKRSFLRYQRNLRLMELKSKNLPEITENEKNIYDYEVLLNQIAQIVLHPKNSRKVLVPGRLVFIVSNGVCWGWSSIVNLDSRGKDVEVIVSAVKDKNGQYVPSSKVEVACLLDVTFPIETIKMISSLTIQNPKTDIGMARASSLLGILDRVYKSYNNQVPLISSNLVTFGKEKLTKLCKDSEEIKKKLTKEELKTIYTGESAAEVVINIKAEITTLENPQEENQIEKIKKSLINLGFINNDNLLELKGRVARLIKLEDPVCLTELLFSAFFFGMQPNMICVVTSCFVESPPKFKCSMTPLTTETWNNLKKSLKKIEDIGLFTMPHKKLMGFAHTFISNGSITSAVKETAGISEGMAVRIAKRMHEIIHMLVEAAKLIGTPELVEAFDGAMEVITNITKLDASLYKLD
ncbi:Helicase conserved C-terminal domain containing protein [Trichomonas vaginalis G3]|uniref:Helicase conserved C-terminal domain containing protein n=1 Tax=Trichomonas vaginalis (strain ATCC PRA-98 / G3) TaxID=412133 RepID=A2E3A0_TRIV3|nr:helicase [Trichomonas vaginalis G3]EAY12910.1 Helicase conserved C-terminal domain containing protein [Trichomonas vaginalis G3]KAI5491919.1 ATP-dependent RNA and DNA helicase family [Trichomonas vaginalis G3]|eukprot:XP_001325133.1 helicase [Trichomonas vaginalis G3]